MHLLKIILVISLMSLSWVTGKTRYDCKSKISERVYQCADNCYTVVQPLLVYAANVQVLQTQLNSIINTKKEVCITQEELNQTLTNQSKEFENNKYRLKAEIKKKDSQILELLSENKSNTARIEELKAELDCKEKDTREVSTRVPDSTQAPDSKALCGHIVIQRRKDGSVNFNRSMKEYIEGFGDPNGEFFLGLEKIHQLTMSKRYMLYISMTDFLDSERFASYDNFVVGGEEEHFKLLYLGEYSGNAGDAMYVNLNMEFSAPDEDNDNSKLIECASILESGWWFNDCGGRLNGVYRTEDEDYQPGISWNTWKWDSLKSVEMVLKAME